MNKEKSITNGNDSLIELYNKKSSKQRNPIYQILNYSYMEIKRRNILINLKEKNDENKIHCENESKIDYEKEEDNKNSNFLEKKTKRNKLICIKSIPKEKSNLKCFKSVPNNLKEKDIVSISELNSEKKLIEKCIKTVPDTFYCVKTFPQKNLKCLKSTESLDKKNNYEEKFDDNYSPKYYNNLNNNIK